MSQDATVIIASKFTKVRPYKAIVGIAHNHAVTSFVIVILCTFRLGALNSNVLPVDSTLYMWHIPSCKQTDYFSKSSSDIRVERYSASRRVPITLHISGTICDSFVLPNQNE